MRVLEEHLERRQFLVAARYTAADIAVFLMFIVVGMVGLILGGIRGWKLGVTKFER